MAKITKLTNFGRPLTKIDEPMQMRPRKALNETANSPKKTNENKEFCQVYKNCQPLAEG